MFTGFIFSTGGCILSLIIIGCLVAMLGGRIIFQKRRTNLILSCIIVFAAIFMTACSEGFQQVGDNIETGQHNDQASNERQETNNKEAQTSTDTSGTTDQIPVELVRVVDGDTIKVIYDGQEQNLRYLLVDTPETNHPRLGKQPFGEEAKARNSELINSGKLSIEFDVGERVDKYGRLLAYVYVDGKMVQETLLEEGLARVAYVYPPNTRYLDQLQNLQQIAQNEAVGIWSIENYVQENGFHPQEKETDASQDCNIKGNIASSGKIYHTPDSPWYEKTNAEEMFCTEEEAKAAGFRAPKY